MNKLFLIKITYIKPIEIVEKIRPMHRDYLKEGYKNKLLLLSGPHKEYNNKLGGIIIGKFKDMAQADNFAKNDPFYLNQTATYEIIEFEAVLFDNALEKLFCNE